MLTTPVIRALRRAYPDAHLTYLVEPPAAPVVARNPHLNDVIVSPLLGGAARLREDARLALHLRRQRFDTVIDFHGGPRSSLLAWADGRADAHRLHDQGARLDVHGAHRPAARPPRRGTRC